MWKMLGFAHYITQPSILTQFLLTAYENACAAAISFKVSFWWFHVLNGLRKSQYSVTQRKKNLEEEENVFKKCIGFEQSLSARAP